MASLVGCESVSTSCKGIKVTGFYPSKPIVTVNKAIAITVKYKIGTCHPTEVRWVIGDGSEIVESDESDEITLVYQPDTPGEHTIEAHLQKDGMTVASSDPLTVTVVDSSTSIANLPTPTNTPTPTATTVPPTDTLTSPQLRKAVTLEYPKKDDAFAGKGADVTLRWSSAGELKEDEYYFVDVRFVGLDADHVCREDWQSYKWTKGTTLTLEPWLFDAMCPDKRHIQWQVYLKQPSASGIERSSGTPLSERSEWGIFYWNKDAGGGGGSGSGGGGGPPPPPPD
jgi:hypothetical protein